MARLIQAVFAVALVSVQVGCDEVFSLDRPPDAPSDAVLDAGDICPSDYDSIGGGRYRLIRPTSTWFAADADCRDDLNDPTGQRFTHLAVLANNDEREVVIALAGAPGVSDSRVWIGLSDVVEGDFRWITTEDDVILPRYPSANGFPPWLLGEPDDGGVDLDQDCVSLENSMLHDHRCGSIQRPAMCECDAFPAR